MNWKLKAHAMAAISRVPGGKSIYHRLQSLAGTQRLNMKEHLPRSIEIVEMIRDSGHDPSRGVYVEVGTGWRPFLPLLLYLVGAERIITLDINPWLTWDYAIETAKGLKGELDGLCQRLRLDRDRVGERYDRAMEKSRDLPSLLAAFNTEYRCPGDARTTGLPDRSVDYVCSSNVLEHVPPDILRDIHRESARLLKPGGLAVHRFNPEDHYSSVDKNITTANFLRYSERQWRWLGGSGLSYHNRLRCPQHRKLLVDAGLTVVSERVRVCERAKTAIEKKEIPIHPDFAGYDSAELAGAYMWLVGQAPVPAPVVTQAVQTA